MNRATHWRGEMPRGGNRFVGSPQRPHPASVGVPAATREDGFAQGLEEGRARGHEQGVRQGHAEGLARGLEEGGKQSALRLDEALAAREREWLAIRDQWLGLCAALVAQRAAWFEGLEDELALLCTEAVTRSVGMAALQPEGIRGIVRRVLEEADERIDVVVRLNPDDVEAVQPALGNGLPECVELRADPDVPAGGCVLVSEDGGLDARLEVLLESVRQGFLQARRAAATA